jgi:hypothetical protein
VSEWKPGDVVAVKARYIGEGGRVFPDDDPRAPLNGRIWVGIGGARSSVLRGDLAPWPDAVRLEALEALLDTAVKLLRKALGDARFMDRLTQSDPATEEPHAPEILAFLAALPGREP